MRSTNLHLVDRRRFEPLPESWSLKKVKESLMESFKKKVADAVEFVSEASIYTPEETIPEHTTAQTIILTLYYGLLFGDLPLCEFIIQVPVPQLRSTFLRVWLADDFTFSRHDVSMVISMLSYMVDSKKVVIPNHILMIFGGLVDKYRVADCCSKELLAVLNNGKVCELRLSYVDYFPVKNEEVPENTDVKENSSIFKNNGLNTIERPINTLLNTFRRVGSKKLFRNRSETAKVAKDEEFLMVEKEDCENADTTCQADLKENISTSSKSKRKPQTHVKKRAIRKLQHYIVVDSDGRTLLHRLARFGLTEAVSRHISEGANLDVTDYSGKTALHWAVEENHSCTAELLLNSGANVNAKTLEGKTPLHLAFYGSGVMSRTWRVLLDHGGTMY